MYNCQVCDVHVGPRVPLQRHIFYRKDGNIEREVPVCGECHKMLKFAPWKFVLDFVRKRKARMADAGMVKAMERNGKNPPPLEPAKIAAIAAKPIVKPRVKGPVKILGQIAEAPSLPGRSVRRRQEPKSGTEG